MSALNVMAINTPEYKSLRAFLLLYMIMCSLILTLLGTIYYSNEKEVMLSEHRLSMQLVNEDYYPLLRYTYFNRLEAFPKDIAYNTAVFDANQKKIDSYIEDEDIDFKKVISLSKGFIHFVIQIEKNPRGVKYLVYETKDNGLWWKSTLKDILLYGTLLLITLIVIGLYLMRLFLRPMKESILLLDNFIKDTTHELNTPVAAILANIENIDISKLEPREAKKLGRIDIAARTISNIYNDLTYLVLHHDIALNNETIDLGRFIEERIEYFKMAMEQKKLTLSTSIRPDVTLVIDKNRLGRLVDNLLSNAIKYNKLNGSIRVELREESLKIIDTGIGISKEKISSIFERYRRVNDSVGGFGIGLHIVEMISKEYDIDIKIESELNRGTEIELKWKLNNLC